MEVSTQIDPAWQSEDHISLETREICKNQVK